MRTAREYVGAAACDGKLIVAGGQDDEIDLACVERYDPRENVWSSMPQMTTARSGHARRSQHATEPAAGSTAGVSRRET